MNKKQLNNQNQKGRPTRETKHQRRGKLRVGPGYVPIVNAPEGTLTSPGYGLLITAAASQAASFPVKVKIVLSGNVIGGYDVSEGILSGPSDVAKFVAWHRSAGTYTHTVTMTDATATESSKTLQTNAEHVSGYHERAGAKMKFCRKRPESAPKSPVSGGKTGRAKKANVISKRPRGKSTKRK